jgi:hypothetical protein
MTIDIDAVSEHSWPDRIKNELNRARQHDPDKPTGAYYEDLEESLHKMCQVIVELRERIRTLEQK